MAFESDISVVLSRQASETDVATSSNPIPSTPLPSLAFFSGLSSSPVGTSLAHRFPVEGGEPQPTAKQAPVRSPAKNLHRSGKNGRGNSAIRRGARGRRWRVTDVRAFESCELVTLETIEAASGTGEPLTRRLLTPFDEVVPVALQATGRGRVRRQLWRRACRALMAAATPPGSLRSAAGARFDILPAPTGPALAVMRGWGMRLLLADEVGLGKTVQAGLVMSELLARGCAERVLILAPAGLRDHMGLGAADEVSASRPLSPTPSLRQLAALRALDVNPGRRCRLPSR